MSTTVEQLRRQGFSVTRRYHTVTAITHRYPFMVNGREARFGSFGQYEYLVKNWFINDVVELDIQFLHHKKAA